MLINLLEESSKKCFLFLISIDLIQVSPERYIEMVELQC
ncbi:hypothetical protein EV10_0233 [Prochlorococcus marinus str. SS51]|nr:hypothetical protein EV04_1308 [Prochlorococcus marinus str. LG]KGG33796.1 hypothetical protein EV10_0233 [Prochlorococcus marinus str. SS51]